MIFFLLCRLHVDYIVGMVRGGKVGQGHDKKLGIELFLLSIGVVRYRKVGQDKKLGIELSGVSFPVPSLTPPWDNQLVSQSISNQLPMTMMNH